MQSPTPVTRALDALGLPYRLFLHDHPVRSLEQAARERGLEPDQIVRSLLFRIKQDAFILVLMPGPKQVSWQKLRHHLGVSRLTTASAQEVREVTGYGIGTVSPFGLKHPLRILADRSLLDLEVVSLGAGMPNSGIILQQPDLTRVLQPEIGDFSEG